MKIQNRILVTIFAFSFLLASCLPKEIPSTSTPLPTTTSTPLPSPTSTLTPTSTSTPIVTNITINDPIEGGMVDMRLTIKGESQNLPEGSVIWVVIYIPSVARYFPTNNPAEMQVNGAWTSLAQIGQEQESGLKADIKVVLANPNAQDVFLAYLQNAQSTNNYSGMDGLPAGAEVYGSISVTRK